MDIKKQQKQPTTSKFNAGSDIRSDLWHDLSLSDLWRQYALLQERISFCQQLGDKMGMQLQLERGMNHLEALLAEKGTIDANAIVIR